MGTLRSAFEHLTEIPACLWNMTTFSLLRLGTSDEKKRGNLLQGSIPPSLTHMKDLVTFQLCHNKDCKSRDSDPPISKVEGVLPELPPSISAFQLSGLPHIRGQIPDQWKELKNLLHLELSDLQNITGHLSPIIFRGMKSLKRCKVNRNGFAGILPWNDGWNLTTISNIKVWDQPNIEGNLFPDEFPEGCSIAELKLGSLREVKANKIPRSILNCDLMLISLGSEEDNWNYTLESFFPDVFCDHVSKNIFQYIKLEKN